MENNLHNVLPIVFVVLLVVWSMYRRVRRTVGLQRLIPGRLRTRAIIFAIIAVLLLVHAFVSPMAAVADAAGVVLGGILAIIAMRTTQFERGSDAMYYRPNPWLGLALIVLLFGRIIYRFTYLYNHLGAIETAQQNAAAGNQAQMNAYTNDPLITGLFFILCTYYVVYYLWLMRRGHSLQQNNQ